MKIDRITLHKIAMPLVHPFQTSFGKQTTRPCIVVALHAEGLTGWGECVAHSRPDYADETITTAWHVIEDFLAPPLLGYEIKHINDLFQSPGYKMVRGHNMAKAALEMALWDLLGQASGQSLRHMLGGVRKRVEVGVSIGIQPELDDLLKRVDSFVNLGYRRIKVKIQPGWDVTPLSALRERHPDIKMMADANSAYSLNKADIFQQMESLNLLMIEQPLAYNDIIDHSFLQARLKTPICLDESIHSTGDARLALKIDACRIINIKQGRVGGLTQAKAIHDICAEADIPVWCGGMLETGIGRAANLALASLPNFTLPGDISASDRYYHQDIAEPTFSLNADDSTITVPTEPGLGVKVNLDVLESVRQHKQVIQA